MHLKDSFATDSLAGQKTRHVKLGETKRIIWRSPRGQAHCGVLQSSSATKYRLPYGQIVLIKLSLVSWADELDTGGRNIRSYFEVAFPQYTLTHCLECGEETLEYKQFASDVFMTCEGAGLQCYYCCCGS